MRVHLIRYHDLGNINTRLPQSLNKRQGVLPPLGLAYIASSLERAGHEVRLIDAIAENLTKEEVRQRIREFSPKVVGVTAMTPTFKGAMEAAQIAKEEGAITVMGGVHMALFAAETLTYDYVDYGVIGEGEETIIDLCDAIENDKAVSSIEGLAYKNGSEIKVGSPKLIANLDDLPFPAYNLLPMHLYSSIIGYDTATTMMGSRGCPYKCTFCYKTPSDKKYRRRNVKSIVDEIEHVMDKYNVKEIMFYDDLMPKPYVHELCNELLERKVKVAWEVPQRVNLVDRESLHLMKRAGCRMLRYGVEQGDPDMMQIIEKRTTQNEVINAFKWTHEAGIETFAYFIVGYINETDETMRSTVDLAKAIDPKYVMFTKAVPLPDTKLMDDAVKQGFIKSDYWQNFVLGKEMEPIIPFVANADEWVKRAYREFYFRPKRILRQLSSLKSFDDIRKSFDAFWGMLFFKMSTK